MAIRALVGSNTGQSFMLKVSGAVVLGRVREGTMRATELEVPEFELACLRITGRHMNRVFILVPSDRKNRFDFGRFYIGGEYEVAAKVNDPRRASQVFRGFGRPTGSEFLELLGDEVRR